MTKEEILSYLDNEARQTNRRHKLTVVYLTTGEILIGEFFRKYQPVRFADDNKWIIYLKENTMEPVEIDGNTIQSLQNRATAFEVEFA
jgi:hypothetical protein